MKLSSIILQSIAKVLVFFINIFALYLMLRGHNNPGGGFIAGLVTAISIVLLTLALGIDEIKKIIRIDPVLFAVLGLLLAYSTSLAPSLTGLPFLKHSFFTWHDVPLLGDVHFGTPLFFDLGVYFVVVGVTCKIILTYSHFVFDLAEYFLEDTFLYSSKDETPVENMDGDLRK